MQPVDPSPPFTLKGPKNHYQVFRSLTIPQIDEIRQKTRKILPLPKPPDTALHLVTSWEEEDPRKHCFGRGAFGVLCIGQPALGKKEWLAIKIQAASSEAEAKKKAAAELAVQKDLKSLPNLLPAEEGFAPRDPQNRPIFVLVTSFAGLDTLSSLRPQIQSIHDPELKMVWIIQRLRKL